MFFSAFSAASASDSVDNATISADAGDHVVVEQSSTDENILGDSPGTFTGWTELLATHPL